ncbi:MAG: serine/threonine-protein kinase [Acidobacteria bacterium]|jgi:serine/threonine-protein kinase|nr:serine/threonine-protein kinase [Acidobacteriota bacterium]
MSLSPGERLGPYEVLGAIGAGGMGEVYRARDTRLDRTVALKVLPSELAADPALKARFEREARAIAALAHPNICTLHDVGEREGRTFLVMEHLVGETLAERLKKGPLPLDQALEVATQIADALAAAHKQGIVHRDLKPANVMLTKTGARLLDFGLARLSAHGARPAVEVLTSAPTEPEPLTARGTIMGTLPYMAPEQVQGNPADARTDLWTLGTILYEMLTGERPFQAPNPTSLVGAILEREPVPLRERQPITPPSLERLVSRCLAKDPDDRWDTAHDVANELRWVAETSADQPPGTPGGPTGRWRRSSVLAVALATGLVGALGVWMIKPSPAPPAIVRSLLDVRPAAEVNAGGVAGGVLGVLTPGGSRTALAWVPGEGALLFAGRRDGVQQLYLRRLDASAAQPLAGTNGAQVPTPSPDGQWVAYWADRAVRKVLLSGGPAAVVAEAISSPPSAMSWGRDGALFLGHPDGLIRRVRQDGVLEIVTERLETEVSHRLPFVLPGGDVLLFTVRKRLFTWGDEEIVAQRLATGERKVLLLDAADARYVPSGHLVFLRRGVLFAVGFDPVRLEVLGKPVPLLEGVGQALAGATHNMTGAGQFAVSPNGSLAYLEGGPLSYPDGRLAAVDRRGQVTVLPAPLRPYVPVVRLSPDGQWMGLVVRSITERGLWLYDMRRGTLTRLTPGGEVFYPAWSPEGRRIAFTWLNDGVEQIGWQPTDGSAAPRVLARDAGVLCSWSPDGRQVATVRTPWGTGPSDDDIWIATLEGPEAALRPLIKTEHGEGWPEFSPDGRWLAYASNDSGRWEVYVQPFPGSGARTQVSVSGGRDPAWNPAGQELFFVTSPDPAHPETRRMMVTEVGTSPPFQFGTPRELFSFRHRELAFDCTATRCYDVSSDGQQFFVVQRGEFSPPSPVTRIHLVQNWLEEVRARVPTGK